MADREHQPRALDGGADRPGIVERVRDRLVDVDRLAGVERLDDQRPVRVVGCGDDHTLDLVVGQQLVVGRRRARHAELGAERGGCPASARSTTPARSRRRAARRGRAPSPSGPGPPVRGAPGRTADGGWCRSCGRLRCVGVGIDDVRGLGLALRSGCGKKQTSSMSDPGSGTVACAAPAGTCTTSPGATRLRSPSIHTCPVPATTYTTSSERGCTWAWRPAVRCSLTTRRLESAGRPASGSADRRPSSCATSHPPGGTTVMTSPRAARRSASPAPRSRRPRGPRTSQRARWSPSRDVRTSRRGRSR